MTRLLAVFRNELGRIFSLYPVLAVMVLAPAVYAVFYPQPYLNEALRDVPIAIVDQDNTPSSRELARRVDATTDIGVAMVLPDLPSAEREVYTRRVYGILLIPQYFERDLLHDRASPIALYADASYFLMYQRIAGGVTAVARAYGAETETARLIVQASTRPLPRRWPTRCRSLPSRFSIHKAATRPMCFPQPLS
jgi:ABC-2 type transport system permease protein